MNAYLIGSLRTGGAESAVKNVVKGMPDAVRNRVVVVLINDKNAASYESELKVKVVNLGASGIFSAFPKLAALIADLGVQRVHAHLAQSIIIAGLARSLRRFEIVAYIHTIGRWKQSPNVRQKLRLQLERVVCNRLAYKVVYVSKLIRRFHEDDLSYSALNGEVIPNPIAADAPLANKNFNQLRLVTVGRLEPVKGLEWVFAASWFDSFFKESSWTLVGNGSLFASLSGALQRKPTLQVALLGNRSDVKDILADHNVFLLPSLSEGLSVAILEAMRAGLPIVCTAVGANTEMVTDGVNGFIIQPGDSNALLIALNKLKDPDTRLRMGLASRAAFLERYDPVIIQGKLESLLA